MTLQVHLAEHLRERVAPLLQRAVADRLATKLVAQDSSLWGPEAIAEASIRMGWTKRPSGSGRLVEEILQLRAKLLEAGVNRVVLCGMGGSSLAPEVMAAVDGATLEILDSTFPAQVARITGVDLTHTVTVVSSKSGGTVETDSQRRVMEAAYRNQGIEPAQRIVVVTDPDTALHRLALEAGYRVFLGDPHVGGRFSALSSFGLVPAGLAGVDIASVVESADRSWEAVVHDSPDNPALVLAAALAAGYPDVNKVLLGDQPGVPGFGDWVEQLVAESTGKNGQGLLPVVGSVLTDQADCLRVGRPGSGAEIELAGGFGELSVLWMFATAFVCRFIGVNPFDQPNVESAKLAAREYLERAHIAERALPEGSLWSANYPDPTPATVDEALAEVPDLLGERGYVALCVFGDQGDQASWTHCRDELERWLQRPVTLGFGPRFLHSTGQFHKGGPSEGVFIQVIQEPEQHLEVPGRGFSFGDLILAQAHGDRQVIAETGQAVASMTISSSGVEALQERLSRL